MVQVEELFGLIDRKKLDGSLVTANFVVRRMQPCKDRVLEKMSKQEAGMLRAFRLMHRPPYVCF
jgi:hypothetical protein